MAFIFLLHQIAERCKVKTDQVKNVIIWGNHSSTQFPDAAHGTVTCDGKEENIYDAVNNDTWLKGEFVEVRAGDRLTVVWS